ncbi:hypothetical protein Y032_0311g2155 [Ancylostoma ceylanicum]|uniref:Uncharacterized protein n=1 Tax=Ancylostoma ceylanicum TaxID=53326 RepID=A0A016S3B6_9BILA|nr:hypothetical protein Y032_0311g2155 [Ancylostoma ceylanicum]
MSHVLGYKRWPKPHPPMPHLLYCAIPRLRINCKCEWNLTAPGKSMVGHRNWNQGRLTKFATHLMTGIFH